MNLLPVAEITNDTAQISTQSLANILERLEALYSIDIRLYILESKLKLIICIMIIVAAIEIVGIPIAKFTWSWIRRRR